MEGKLNSLTDVLKKTLYFFDSLSVEEITPYVHRKMLKDYPIKSVEEKIALCLKQHVCFYHEGDKLWRLNLQGHRENDYFYNALLKRQTPMSLREITRNAAHNRKNHKLAEEAALMSDGRLVQFDNGSWGLTEWSVETEQYSLKHLIIKALKLHPGGLSSQQVFEVVNTWRPTTTPAISGVLNKFPYFERVGEGIWSYNQAMHSIYDQLVKRYINILRKQKNQWQIDREKWQGKNDKILHQLNEVRSAQREAAAALAERIPVMEQYNHLATQLSEKDLLLNMRKKEILRFRNELERMNNKANSILYQCRQWVRRTNEANAEVTRLNQLNEKNQSVLESMFSKLQQYKEKDRENKARLAEFKDKYSTRVAELQTEIVELKQKLERYQVSANHEERLYQQEVNVLSNDLQESLEKCQEFQKSLKLLEKELKRTQEEKLELELKISRPLVSLALRLSRLLGR